MTSMQLNATMRKMSIGSASAAKPLHAPHKLQPTLSAAPTETSAPPPPPCSSSSAMADMAGGDNRKKTPAAAAMVWMSSDPAVSAAAVWANRSKPLFSQGLMDALREKGAVTSFVDVDGGTKAPPATIPEPEPEPICSLEEEMLTLRTRLKQARDEIRASTAEALGCKNDLKVVRHKNKYNRLTRKSSLEALNNNGGRWSGAGSRRGSVDNAWASTSKKSVAGRRRRRHNVESGGRNVDGSSGGVGGHLHLRNMSSSTAEEDAAGEHIFDGSTISLLTSDNRKSRLGLMMKTLQSRECGSAADLFAQESRDSPVSRMAGHGAMPSSPKHRRRKKKGNGSSGSRTPKGSPKQNRRKHKRTNPDGSPRKRGGKKGVGVKASRSVPVQSSTLTRASFSSATPRLPMPGKSHSAPSSPRVSRRGADAAPSPSQLADAIATKPQSPLQSRAGSLLTLAPKLSALMQTGMQHQAPSSAISG
eukprot:gene12266-27566_t